MNKKKLIAVFLLSTILLTGLAYAFIYWTRCLTHQFSVVGIKADLIQPTFNGYINKIIASDLTNDKIGLIIEKENFYNIWLNITVTAQAPGLVVTMQGQYYNVRYEWGGLSWTEVFVPNGAPFTLTNHTAYTVDKTQMMYVPISAGGGETGHMLVLTLNYDTELVLEPGDYTSTMLFEMGFV